MNRNAHRHGGHTWLAMLVIFMLMPLLASPVQIQGGSMEPTLPDGSWVIVSPLAVANGHPPRGSIVVLRQPQVASSFIIKRIVAIQGDCVAARDGAITLDDRLVEEPFVHQRARYNIARQCLADGHVFVLGDNRTGSVDSARWGSLLTGDVAGRIIVTLPPIPGWARWGP